MRPSASLLFCLQTLSVRFILLITPLRQFDFFVSQWLLVQKRRLIGSLIFPGTDEGKVVVITLGFSIFSLIFHAEMSAAGFLARQSVERQQLAELQEIGHPT